MWWYYIIFGPSLYTVLVLKVSLAPPHFHMCTEKTEYSSKMCVFLFRAFSVVLYYSLHTSHVHTSQISFTYTHIDNIFILLILLYVVCNVYQLNINITILYNTYKHHPHIITHHSGTHSRTQPHIHNCKCAFFSWTWTTHSM